MQPPTDPLSGPRQLIFLTGETWIMAIPMLASGPTPFVSLRAIMEESPE